MLLRLDPLSNTLSKVLSSWTPKELELESYLINSADTEVQTLSYPIFGENLLLVSNQVKTRTKKRADILALDQAGNSVIIELKRDTGLMGVETQALQYLADFSRYRGRHFVEQFKGMDEGKVKGFLGNAVRIEELNTQSRIILIARDFDPTVYSMGEWLSDKGVAFRCIAYTPVEVAGNRFISFSVKFDRAPKSIFPVSFNTAAREPGVYWHNIGRPSDSWWQQLKQNGEIPTCFEGAPGDEGERILKKYIPGDRIVAYAKGFGAVGWGVVSSEGNYELLPEGHPRDTLGGSCRHRLPVKWKATALSLKDGLPPDAVRREYGIYHPLSTSVGMDLEAGQLLIERLSALFSNGRA